MSDDVTHVLGVDNMANSLSNLDDVSTYQTGRDPKSKISVDEVSTDSGVSATTADTAEVLDSDTGCKSNYPPPDYDVTQF